MKHNRFDYDYDLIKPLAFFFKFHLISTKKSDFLKKYDHETMERKAKFRGYILSLGYLDERDRVKQSQYNMLKQDSKTKKKAEKDFKISKYYNNF